MKQTPAVNQLKAGLRKASISTQTSGRFQVSGFLKTCLGLGTAKLHANRDEAAGTIEKSCTAVENLNFCNKARRRIGYKAPAMYC